MDFLIDFSDVKLMYLKDEVLIILIRDSDFAYEEKDREKIPVLMDLYKNWLIKNNGIQGLVGIDDYLPPMYQPTRNYFTKLQVNS